MMKSESDLMKGIDDKFQQLLSQFEMNMNFFEMKSKRQQYIIDQNKDEEELNSDNKVKSQKIVEQASSHNERVKESPETPGYSSAESSRELSSAISSKDKKETESEKSTSLVTVKNMGKNKAKTVYSMKLDMAKSQKQDETEKPDAMGSVLKYISECADVQNKKIKKRKKNISFTPQNNNYYVNESDDEKSVINITTNKKKLKKKKSPMIVNNDNLSKTSSKKRSNKGNEVNRKCSKTVTNVSKKGKKRNARNYNISGKDWISFNRNNAGKLQRSSMSKSKTQLFRKEDTKVNRNTKKKESEVELKRTVADTNQKNKIEHYDSVENKLIKDFLKNDLYESQLVKKRNAVNDLIKRSTEKLPIKKKEIERISFRNPLPTKVLPPEEIKLKEPSLEKLILPKRIGLSNIKRNIMSENILRNDRKRDIDIGKNIAPKRSVSTSNNNKENRKMEINQFKYIDDRKSVISNIETGKSFSVNMKNIRDLDMSVARSKSEMKVRPSLSNMYGKEDNCENLEDVKEELDEYFRAIPFVVGRSISRTFNLGLSFQHAMSMLKRIHNTKEVKDALSIGHPESIRSESLHCLGSNGNCEAMFSSDWTKEDEEAWEENPWDPELNKRRPKCTCLPNNCTTLKNVLKQLTLKNPSFNMRPLQSSYSSTTNKMTSEVDIFKRAGLKKAKSHTRTELLRNIRTIQIQLTPFTEILK